MDTAFLARPLQVVQHEQNGDRSAADRLGARFMSGDEPSETQRNGVKTRYPPDVLTPVPAGQVEPVRRR